MEKCQGYQYEHCFSQDWEAVKGYHFLMRLGHLLNTLAQNTLDLAILVQVQASQPIFTPYPRTSWLRTPGGAFPLSIIPFSTVQTVPPQSKVAIS